MSDEPRRDRTREYVRLGAGAVLLALVIAFVVDNTRSVHVGFVFFDRRPPLIWVLVVTLALGVALDRLWIWRRRR